MNQKLLRLKSLEELGDGTFPLAIIDRAEERNPVVSRTRDAVKFSTIHKGRWGAGDTTGSSIFPDSASLILSGMHISITVIDTVYILGNQAELLADLVAPLCLEVVTSNSGFSEDVILLCEAVVEVVVHVAGESFSAPIKKVWKDLGHLPRVQVVVEGERADLESDCIQDWDASDLGLLAQHILPNAILGLGVGAKEIHEDLNPNVELIASLDPSRVSSKDRHTIGSNKAKKSCRRHGLSKH